MYSNLPNLIIGFHGCDESTMKKVLYEHQKLLPSDNVYDWLGNGIYFWENSIERAKDWAEDYCKRQDKKNPLDQPRKPAVIGAVISLGHCLDLTDFGSAQILNLGFDLLKYELELNGKELPVNKSFKGKQDVLLRELDCAVIQRIHQYNIDTGQRKYDSVRGIFTEGNPVYEGSCILEKTHTQLCIVNPNCIKGYFKPLEQEADWINV